MKHLFQKVDTFSIRKLSIGACSIIVGTMFLGSSVAHADATDTTLFLSGSDSYVLTEETNQDGQTLAPLVPLLSEEAPVTESSEALLVGSAPASETAEIPLGENQEKDKESLLSPSLEIEVDKVEVADVIGENVEQLPPSRLETEETVISNDTSNKGVSNVSASSVNHSDSVDGLEPSPSLENKSTELTTSALENQGVSGFRRAGGNYVGDGCVRWVKDRARGLLGIGLPNTGYNKYGLAGASAYWDLLPRHGYQRGGEPAKNSLAVWEETIVSVGGTYKYGHVAYVEEVQGDNIVLSQGGMPSSRYTWGGHVGVQYATFHKSQLNGTSIARKFLGYVYLREQPAPPAPPVHRYNTGQVAVESGQSVSDGDYHIVSHLNPALGIDVQSASPANGTNIHLWDNATTPDQVFTVTHLGGGYYKLIHKHTSNSIDATATDRGANVNSYSYHGGENQHWILKPTGDGQSFEIVNRHSGLVLDIAGGNISKGTNIQLYDPNGSGAQKFRLVSVDADAKQTIADGSYHIASLWGDNRFGIDVANGDTTNGTNIQIYDNLSDSGQVFDVRYLGNGYYTLTHRASGKRVDVSGNRSYNGSNVVLHDANDSDAQQWIIKDVGNGYYEIISKQKNMALDADASSGIPANGLNVSIYRRQGSPNQIWKFISVDADAKQTIADGSYHIASLWGDNRFGIDVANGDTTNGTNIQIYDNLSDSGQVFDVRYLGNGYYTLTHRASGKRVDVNGSNVVLHDANDSDTQQWIIKDIGNGYYEIISKQKNMALDADASSGMPANGLNVSIYRRQGSPNQFWKFIKEVKYVEGWKQDKNGWLYQYSDGTYIKNDWKQINSVWYHFDSSGYMQTGWQKINGNDYYFKATGAMASDEWVDNKYYVDKSGRWLSNKKKTTAGWKSNSTGWWYENTDGSYPKNDWKLINNKWYYFNTEGYMVTGWQKINGNDYYFKSTGEMASDEWVDNKYYVDKSGRWIP